MFDPEITISIDRTSLALGPLVLSGQDDATTLSIVEYTEPAIEARVTWAPTSQWAHGQQATASAYEQTLLQFDVSPWATSETLSRAALAELRTALAQFSFEVTVTVGDAPAETWTCNAGSVGGASRTFENLKTGRPVHPVTIPAYPVRSA